MSTPIPEPAWCYTCHPDGGDWHDDQCCCGVKTKVKDGSDEGEAS
jgi:hypothetical protein